MNLFETVKEATLQGYHVTFSPFINQFVVIVKKAAQKDGYIKKESVLPISDHFYEEKVIQVINWSISEIHKQIYDTK